MATAKLRKVGGSTMLAIPPSILEALGLSAGSNMDLTVRDGAILAMPTRQRYTLDELLAQCDQSAPMSDEDRDWLDAPAIGREI